MTALDTFVLTRAIKGVVQSAVLEGHPGIYDSPFEDALVRLVEGYRSAR